jgi:eukaryotic-like serine/threonine-protein kinase
MQPEIAPTDPEATVPPAVPAEQATLPPHEAVLTIAHSESAPAPRNGAAVPGYEILRELGRGGMGVVYQARHTKLDRVVALKMILAGGHAGEADLARFKTEAESVARLQHPHIVQIFEVGEHGGLPFFSLEYCPGGSLDKKLNGTPLPPKEAAALVEKLARAMQAAHDKGVVHRDLKPANVLLAGDGEAKITDFGLAKKLDADAGQTRTGAVMGTPSYMAPEQADGKKDVGPAADTYALGAILYECLTGRPPFKAATALDTVMQVVADEPVPPRQLQSKTPRDLETICLKCLEKQPGRRYATATELAEDLRRFQAGEPVRARAVGMMERAGKWTRRRPALAAAYGFLLTALVLGIGGGGATWLWLRAENARGDAEAAQTRAEKARGEAETAEDGAKQARDDLKGALQREQDAKHLLTEYSYADRVYLSQREWDAGRVNGARELLKQAGDLQEELKPGRRPWEWQYLNRVFHPELAVLEGHTEVVISVTFSPDGCRVATASKDGTARLRDAVSGKLLAVLQGHTAAVTSAAFSPGGGRVVTASDDKTARLWDAASGKLVAALQGHTDQVFSMVFSPDSGRVVTASLDKTARLWDAASGKPLAVLQGHTDQVISVAFSPDGRRLATASLDKTARLWDAVYGKPLAVLQGHTGGVGSVAFSPDGGRVATASLDSTARLWDADSGKLLAVLQGHTAPVISVVFSPDGGRVGTAGWDKTARLWDAISGKLIAVLEGHTAVVHSVVFSPDGSCVATASSDKTARLWDAVSGKPIAVLQGHTGGVTSVAFSPDGGRVATAGDDNTARLWDALSGKPLVVLQGRWGSVGSVTFSLDGSRVATASDDETARLWDAASGKLIAVLRGHTDQVSSVTFSRDGGRIATTSRDMTARLWDAASGKPLAVLRGHTRGVWSVAFSPDGGRVATASADNTARLWDAASGKLLTVLQGHTGGVTSVAFSPDGGRVATTAGGDKAARLWDAASGKLLAVLHTNGFMSWVFSPDGSRVATASDDKTARLWDAASGKPLAVLQGHTADITSVTFSPDGGRVVTASKDNTARLWDAASGKPLAVLDTNGVTSVTFSPDGSRVATASWDETAQLWDAVSGKSLAVLQGHKAPVHSVAFSPDGSRVATASDDETARLWDAASGKPLAVLEGNSAALHYVAFSPDGCRVATVSDDNTARLWIARESQEDQEKRRREKHRVWRERQRSWQEQQAAEAEKAGQWFAAAFHLSRLINAETTDASLYARRCKAYTLQSRWGAAVADLLQEASLTKPIIANPIGMKLVRIEPGAFTMGSPFGEAGRLNEEGPQHQVSITQPFYMGAYLVTKGQFAAFVKDEGYQTEAEKAGQKSTWRIPDFDKYVQTDNDPVVYVSWNDAVKFCAWLSKKEKKTYELPTEAEWEYACRAGTTTAYSFGADPNALGDYAWFDGNSEGHTHRVGAKNPNPWGLYDMHGNVCQWCGGRYDKNQDGSIKDPKDTYSGESALLRGGSWYVNPARCRSAMRVFCGPSFRHFDIGFRVVLRSAAATP